jgi:hypothetical protein
MSVKRNKKKLNKKILKMVKSDLLRAAEHGFIPSKSRIK